ncbi:mechanosensitive ion channel family protein [Halopseudomonas salegens]|uniref:Mechanosensitive ion channel n=1 Tax=Halopseudomonas salegens TaxID=1434072 RepID=A0A1H2E001_9GAMM|nr:mechanosensitive ion channel family protein [Halopseudomonas salegens]SDT88424.1 Mechanosensitive ion channel [Halopseudomonas salegens]
MDTLLNTFTESVFLGKLISSGLLIIALSMAYRLGAASIRRVSWSTHESQRRWLVMARYLAVIACIFLLIVVWADQLRTLALSVVAFAAAIILSTKELLMCFTGGMLRSSAGMFSLGDRIEVKKLRGDVIDLTMLTTTILEIGPEQLSHQHTGRAIVLPNSTFLSEAVINESFTEDYVLHISVVPLSRKDDWSRAERHLLQAANEVCGEFIQAARTHLSRLGKQQGIDVPSVEPRITLLFPKPEEINLLVRFPVPARKKGRTEQAMLRRYLTLETEAAKEAVKEEHAGEEQTDGAPTSNN